VRPGRTTFKVTPKEGIDRGGWEAVRQFRLLMALAALLAIGLLLRVAEDAGVGPLPPMHGFAAWFVPVLGAVELRRVGRTLIQVGHRRQLRGEYRTPLTAAAVLVPGETIAEDGPSLLARMRDMTTTGVGFELSRPLPVGTRASLTVQLPGVGAEPTPTRMEVEIRSCNAHDGDWRIGATIVDCEENDRRRVLAYCNVVWPYMRLRGEADEAPSIAGLSRADAEQDARWSSDAELASTS
jgi:hypothetical protein